MADVTKTCTRLTVDRVISAVRGRDTRFVLFLGAFDRALEHVQDMVLAWEFRQMYPHTFETRLTHRLEYLLYLPETYASGNPTPLLLYLHGGGDSGSEVARLKAQGLPKLLEAGMTLPCVVLAPQNPYPEQLFPEAAVAALLDEVMATYRVDPERVYLTGYSRGGFGAWQLATQRPDVFAALVPVAAGGLPTYAFRLKNVPVWAFHGSQDEAVPLSYGTAMVEALRAAGGQAKLTVLETDHSGILEQTYRDPALYRWLLEQTKAH